jgi:serine/threonine protein kinase
MEPKLLGGGTYGTVFRGYLKGNPDYKLAIKVLPKKKLITKVDCIKKECQILQKLDHPNIIKVN